MRPKIFDKLPELIDITFSLERGATRLQVRRSIRGTGLDLTCSPLNASLNVNLYFGYQLGIFRHGSSRVQRVLEESASVA